MNADGTQRSFAFFLHGHLPWVLHHGLWPHGAEWLCEAMLETYLPLLTSLRRLRAQGIRGGVTLGVSPVLAEQLSHPDFAELFREYLDERIRTVGEEAERFRNEANTETAELCDWWREQYEASRQLFFDELGGDLLGALRDLESTGSLEIATCGATHGYFPLLGRDESIALQVELARRVHERHFGRPPRGMWIPEAAYRPAGPWSCPVGHEHEPTRAGVEDFLVRAGMRYFIVDSSLLAGGRSVGSYPNLFRRFPELREHARAASPPLPIPDRVRDTRHSYWVASDAGATPGVRCFVRDPKTALQVWSGDHGYPGDPAYLEFHKKSDGGGHRYWRVTGPRTPLGDKAYYAPDVAQAQVETHAWHFRDLVAGALEGSSVGSILAAPFDAELFGHWWSEGVLWLEKVLEGMAGDKRVAATTFARHAEDYPPEEIVRLPEGSWGEGGKHWIWLNPDVEWTWRVIHPAEDQFWALWRRIESLAAGAAPMARRVTLAAARQLTLLCASDWQFLMTTDAAVDYATLRVRRHAEDFDRLIRIAQFALADNEPSAMDIDFLERVETRDDLFPEMEEALRAASRMTSAIGA